MKFSIIIPTLNEAAYLAETLQQIKSSTSLGEPYEIIVIDSGSYDTTCEIAQKLEVKLLQYKSGSLGKAEALNEAAQSASGDVYLFLDADTLVPEGFDTLIKSALIDPKVVGGAFEFTLDGPDFGLRVVEFINRVRYRIRQRYYGDQGVFVRAEIFLRAGGYPKIALMESTHLCKKLRKLGKLVLINENMKTSPRRFIDRGIYRVLASDIKIWFLDFIGVSVDKYASSYWKENQLRFKN